MPARKPAAVRTRDQLVAFESGSDEGKERMIGELARTGADAGKRLGDVEALLARAPTVTGSRASGAALESLLEALAGLGLITDETVP